MAETPFNFIARFKAKPDAKTNCTLFWMRWSRRPAPSRAA